MAHLAVDLGANGGTAYLGGFEGGVTVEEIHRFDNRPVERDGRYVWEIGRLREEVETAVRQADGRAELETVGTDTWGVDFGLVRDGELLRLPSSYREPSVASTREEILDVLDRREIFEATGINNWNTPNTLWQYHHLVTREPDVLERADQLLMTPQLLSTLLGGRPAGELTIASTTQMLDTRTGTWAEGLLDALDLPTGPLPAVEEPGGRLGPLRPELADGLDSSPDLVLPASHDTASAVAGLPLDDGGRAFLSTGTWFIPGVELPEPKTDDDAFAAGVSNELGAGGRTRFIRNVTGFFLLEECRLAWESAGGPTGYAELIDGAREAEPFGPLVDPDAGLFDIRSDMPATIREFCVRTDQRPPRDRGAVVRTILESLAAKAALVVEEILEAAGTDADRLHLGGGGVRNDLFCGMLASALDRRVLAGPTEATAVGNLLTQAVAAGSVDDLAAGRRRIADAVPPTAYDPGRTGEWADAKTRMRDLVGAELE
jgi:rhamnulokinase